MLNYSIQDLLAVLFAFALFPLFVFVPGYMFGLALNLLDFRGRTPLVRTLLSLIFSVSLTPVVIFVLGSLSATLEWIFFAVVWIGFLIVLAVPRFPKPYGRPVRMGVWVPGLAIALSVASVLCFSLIDLHIGTRLDLSISTYDYNFRAAVIDSITRRGLPPINPFLHPGGDVAFRYHYFWFMICSLVDTLGGKLISARQAQIAGTAWAGISLCAFVAVYLRFFDPQGARNIRKRAYAGLALLLVTGFDIIPILVRFAASFRQPGGLVVVGSGEWWSVDPVTSWIHALLWVPHHVVGVIACLTGFLLLWNLDADATLPRRGAAWFGAALAFASATGLSIHVTFAFGCAMVVWGAVALFTRRYRAVADLVAAGLCSVVVAAPYLVTLISSSAGRGSAGGAESGGGTAAAIPLSFGIRQFRPIYPLLKAAHIDMKWMPAVNLLALPLNYFLEFGFFAVIAVLFYRARKSEEPRTREYRLAIASIVGTVLVVCTFLRSTVIGNNDLGWRGILIAQFLLLIVAVDYVLAMRGAGAPAVALRSRTRTFLVWAFWLGMLPSLFEVATQRFHPLLAETGLVAPALEDEAVLSKRAFALRQIYGGLSKVLPADAVVQHNPGSMQDIPSGLYADRQRVLMGNADYTSFGGNFGEQERARKLILTMFSKEATEADFNKACQALGMSAVIVTDTDPVWEERQSWAWKQRVLEETPIARAVACSH